MRRPTRDPTTTPARSTRRTTVVAFPEFDAARHRQASAAFTFALSCAEQAGDWHLRAKALSGMARQAIWRGDPDSGLTCVELALVRADRLTCTERAMLLTARARALALMGRVAETLRCVHAADEQFGRREPDEDPPWMAYYDEASIWATPATRCSTSRCRATTSKKPGSAWGPLSPGTARCSRAHAG